MSVAALILAAGEGTRMRSDLPKVAHRILGVPMLGLVLDVAREVGCDPVVIVTGHGAEAVEALYPGEAWVRQDRQLGTGHAVMCAESALADACGSLLVLSGDTPLLRPRTLSALLEARESSGAAVSVLTTRMPDATGYGRIIRGRNGDIEAIVEQKDATSEQLAVDEVNTGTYCFDAAQLFAHLHRLGAENAQGEYYLTDMIAILRAEGLGVASATTDAPAEAMGVNTRVQLAEASRVLQRRTNEAHMLAGVTMTDPDLVWISPGVTLGRDVIIEPMTFLAGNTSVGDGVRLGPNTRLDDTTVERGAVVEQSVVRSAEIGENATVGPNAFLRPGTVLRSGAKVGSFVEVKNTTIGVGSKVPHLSYMGDAAIGDGVNVGAGAITCNYDGVSKHPTVIDDGAFVGSDTMLVAPVRIGKRAVTGAGSAIAKDVPDGALGIERTEQRNLEGWADRKRNALDTGDE
jgi:bifunctional UDP-N-acetylglucosamine pyrophosphorylase/glucosamine-1-phosphate N-acetyltransferase